MMFDSRKLQVVSVLMAIGSIGLIMIGAQASAFDLVDTGVSQLSPDGKHVSVNVPGFFNMILDTRGPQKGVRMTQSIMMGLVKVDMDRVNGTDGRMMGPLKVTVAGIPVYNNRQPPVTNEGREQKAPEPQPEDLGVPRDDETERMNGDGDQ